jgi:hypothetical protein
MIILSTNLGTWFVGQGYGGQVMPMDFMGWIPTNSKVVHCRYFTRRRYPRVPVDGCEIRYFFTFKPFAKSRNWLNISLNVPLMTNYCKDVQSFISLYGVQEIKS